MNSDCAYYSANCAIGLNQTGADELMENFVKDYPEEIELLLAQVPEIKECMVYGKQDEKDPSNKELIISVKVIPNLDKIGENLTDEEIREIIWPKIKEVNKKLTSYKAIKNLEIKHDEFEKTTTMKIKRYAEIKKSK